MLNLQDKLFMKRFCLPVNSDIDLYENGLNNVNVCLCGHYNHVACILQFYKGNGNMKKIKILSFGMNQMADSKGLNPGVHAEQDALNKLPSVKYKKKLETISMLVLRLSSKNKLQSSKPCANCIESMKIYPIKKGYRIHNIYHSDGEGNIIKTTLHDLDNDTKHYSRYYRQRERPY